MDYKELVVKGCAKNLDIGGSTLSKWIKKYIKNIKNPFYLLIMNVLAEASSNDVVEMYKNIEKAQLSSENMDFILEMMKKLELDKKLKSEGVEGGLILQRIC